MRLPMRSAWGNQMKVRRGFVGTGLAVMLLVFAGCGDSENDSRKVGAVETGGGPATLVQPPSDAFRVGDIVKLGDAQVIVHGVMDPYDSGTQFARPPAGSRYVMVDAEVKNLSSDTQVLSAFSQFEMKDSKDESYDPIVLPGSLPAVGGQAPPGAARRGLVAFQVPEGAAGMRLIFKNLLFGKGSATIFLG